MPVSLLTPLLSRFDFFFWQLVLRLERKDVVTLAANRRTTTVSPADPVHAGAQTVAPQSAELPFPKAAHAAADLAAGGCYISSVSIK